MKKLFLIFLLFGFYSSLFCQENYKGKISLHFDEKKIEVPITKIAIHKNDNIQIEVFGEEVNGSKNEMVMLYIPIESFASKKILKSNLTIKIDYGSGKFNRTKFLLKGNFAQFNSRAKQVNFNDVKTDIQIKEISYHNNSVKITGSFSGVYSAEANQKYSSGSTNITNGTFEIIL